MAPQYPRVSCSRHPEETQPGYVACIHVIESGRAYRHQQSTAEDLGALLCAACSISFIADPDNYRVLCRKCALERIALPS
jgi:hypothetical protein